jgi:hypothetical protein
MTKTPFTPNVLETKGLIKQELISYRSLGNGSILKITVSRTFYKDGDYQDTRSEEVLRG